MKPPCLSGTTRPDPRPAARGRTRRRLAVLAAVAGLATAGLTVVGSAPAGADGYTTAFMNVNTAGQKGDGTRSRFPSVSETALIVAFDSEGKNLVSDDTNGQRDIFVRYRGVPMTVRASVSTAGVQANGASARPSLSSFAERVAFESAASNLVPGDTNATQDIFVRNLYSPQSTALVSVSSTGVRSNGFSSAASLSKGDARYVSFTSSATNLVPNDTNGVPDIFVRDLVAGTTTRVSVSSSGAQGNALSSQSSTTGRFVAFKSDATNLVPGDTNGVADIFVYEIATGITTRVSVSGTGAQSNGTSELPSMTYSDSLVAFDSDATNLVPGDTNRVRDVFLRQRILGTTERASVSSTGEQGNAASSNASVGDNVATGGLVAFTSSASNLVPGDTNGLDDIFRRDTSVGGDTQRWSVATDGSQAGAGTATGQPAMTHFGQHIAFVSNANNLAPGDTLLTQDVFLRYP
jgi:hypothetical protein